MIKRPMDLIVTPHATIPHQGILTASGREWLCALGRNGVTQVKQEGDGATPTGCWPLRHVWVRQDRIETISTGLPCSFIDPHQGWCDAPRDEHYNKPVRLPYPASTETMWRADELYDVAVIIGYNDDPIVSEAGSAIFLHIAGEDLTPTEGCVALSREALLLLLPHLSVHSRIIIHNRNGSRK
ncbi:MAG: L,D-transpeptidase family protein [Parvularculales bacterium]